MKAPTTLEMVMWLRGKMNDCEYEIRYLEELLVTTSGPAEEILNSLEANKKMYIEFETEYNRYVELMKENEND